MNEKEKMLAGELYNPFDKELVALRLNARLLVEELNRTSAAHQGERVRIIKTILGSTGKNCFIEAGFNCDYGCNIHVGNNFWANFGVTILDPAEVRIGKNCFVGPQVGLYTATHPLDPKARVSGKAMARPITLGDNCWIGGHAVINPGVNLGDNVVVASGAVVTQSFGDNVVLGGNPAKVIKTL